MAQEQEGGRPRLAKRIASMLLVSFGVLLIATGAYTGWLRTQVLDTDAWVDTSRAALERDEVRTAVAVWTVDTVFERTDPEAALAGVLPERAKPLAGPLTSRLRLESYEVAERALGDARVEEAWVVANRNAHERFVRIVEGDDPIVVDGPGGMRIDLRPLLERIAARIGVGEAVVERIPDRITTVESTRSEQVERGLDALRVLDAWGYRIAFIGIAFLLLGIWLAPSRRRSWMWAGGAIAVAGWLVGQSRDALRTIIAEAVSEATTWQAATAATWDTVSAPLQDASVAGIVIGVGIILLAWMTGPADVVVDARRLAAPVLVDRTPIALGVGLVLALLLVNGIDALDTRRTGVKLVLVLGVVGATWAISRAAANDRLASDTPSPASGDDPEVA